MSLQCPQMHCAGCFSLGYLLLLFLKSQQSRGMPMRCVCDSTDMSRQGRLASNWEANDIIECME